MLARECASMLIDHVVAAVPDGLCRLLSQLVAEATFPANLAALQMLHARLDQDFEVSGTRLTILVSSLLKVSTFPLAIYASLNASLSNAPQRTAMHYKRFPFDKYVAKKVGNARACGSQRRVAVVPQVWNFLPSNVN